MTNYSTWIDALVILIHIAQRNSDNSELRSIVSRAAHELNMQTAGGAKYYSFRPCDILTGIAL